MANALYPIAKQRLLEWVLGVSPAPVGAGALYMAGVTSAYTYSATHENVSDLTGIVMPEAALQNVTLTNGVIDADDLTTPGMTIGQTLNALILYAKWAGDDLLIAYMDTPGDATIPQVINSTLGLIMFDVNGICRI